MKRLLVALLLSVILTVTLATPALAGEWPEAKPGMVTFGPGWYGVVMNAMINVHNSFLNSEGNSWHVICDLVESGPPVKYAFGKWK